MSEKVFRVGIVGCGGIANGKHLPALAKLAAEGMRNKEIAAMLFL